MGSQPPVETKNLIQRVLGGNYLVGQRLGEGGSAEVFLAYDLQLNRKVALKFLIEDESTEKEVTKAFLNEGRILASLKHPGIVTVFSAQVEETLKFPFLVMEYFEGVSLDERGQEFRENPIFLFRLMIQILEAIHACHTHPNTIIHRDLKPTNILINTANEIKVIDFGISLVGKTDLLSGYVIGSPEYMAPELYEGKPTTPKTDIYALGIMFWELMIGKVPFSADPNSPDPLLDLKNQHCTHPLPLQILARSPFGSPLC
ncbi:MAG: serine/threonine-protein kinase, partial [Candidatus Ozemobacteraceae bacterium]